MKTEILHFYTTASYACSYLPERKARSQIATPTQTLPSKQYAALIQLGFRRSGLLVYRPYCDDCQACIPLRVDTNQFVSNRSQKRAWQQHEKLILNIEEPHFDEAHYQLYRRYQSSRHAGGDMDQDSANQYAEFLIHSQVQSYLLSFRDPETGELKMVAIVDRVEDGLSAVYTFYDPNDNASYGTYAVLCQIALARQLQLPYLYLGYWVEQSKKMAYKSKFKPFQTLENGVWQAQD